VAFRGRLVIAERVKPHLIHIGWAKAGSSVLQNWFKAHPQIAFSEGGLLGVRSSFDIANGKAGNPAGIRLRVTSDETLSTPHATAGEDVIGHLAAKAPAPDPTPEQVCEHLRDLFPEAVVLIVTRGFREVILSSFSEGVKRGGMHFFAPWLENFGAPGHHAFGKWDYDRAVACYEAAFPGRVIVLPYELLRDRPDDFIANLERRFGLDHVPLAARVINKSLSAAELAWYPLFTRFVRYAPLFGWPKRRMMRSYFSAITRRRLRGFAEACQRLVPRELPKAGLVDAAIVARFSPNAQTLRSRSVYGDYLRDYLPDDQGERANS
jgi:hypothetical protein